MTKIKSMSLNLMTNRMIKINPKSSDVDSFIYLILISLHYYDFSFHPERIWKLKPFQKQYHFIHITPTKFETNNSNILLTIFGENNKKSFHSSKNNRYAALKPRKNKFMQLEKMLKSFSKTEF